jgi:uncharacterized protein YkwD
VLIGRDATASAAESPPVHGSLELSIGDRGLAADVLDVRRSKALLVAAVLLVAVVLGATASPARSSARHETQLRSLNRQIAAAINAYRQTYGLKPLRISAQLDAAARQHSEEMGTDGYFDHPSADGTQFWKRIENYYPSANYSYWTVGENLLWASPSVGAVAALKMWVASPEHRENLRNKDWRDLGVSAVHVVDAGGVYGGRTVTIITTDFGARH